MQGNACENVVCTISAMFFRPFNVNEFKTTYTGNKGGRQLSCDKQFPAQLLCSRKGVPREMTAIATTLSISISCASKDLLKHNIIFPVSLNMLHKPEFTVVQTAIWDTTATLLALKSTYSGRTRSIPWLPMPWPLPDQQLWHLICSI